MFGGENGVWWMRAYPFAVANLLCAALLFAEAVAVKFWLRETLDMRKFSREQRTPPWKEFQRFLRRFFGRGTWGRGWERRDSYAGLDAEPPSPPPEGLLSDQVEMMELNSAGNNLSAPPLLPKKPPPTLPLSRIWTPNVIFTLMSIAVFDFHMG
jgi:hypothetical protein